MILFDLGRHIDIRISTRDYLFRFTAILATEGKYFDWISWALLEDEQWAVVIISDMIRDRDKTYIRYLRLRTLDDFNTYKAITGYNFELVPDEKFYCVNII